MGGFQEEKKTVRFDDDNFLKLEEEHNLFMQVKPNPESVEEYNPQFAIVIARLMSDINMKYMGECFGQQYILQKGLNKFKKSGEKAVLKELKQLHDCVCFLQF